MASMSPTLPVHNDSEIVIVVGPSAAASQSVARPLPDVAIPAKVNRYVRRLFSRYDTNGDGVIDATERRQMQGDPTAIDYSANGEITLEELAAYTADFGRHRRMRLTGSMVEEAVADLPPLYVPTAEREARAAALAAAQQAAQQGQAVPVALVNETAEVDMVPADDSEAEEEGGKSTPSQPTARQSSSKRFVTPKSRTAGLPEWFSGRDANGDGQLTVAEYTPSSDESRLTEFNRYDRNKDGVLTPQECPKQ
jgi:EF hand domain-containing protein